MIHIVQTGHRWADEFMAACRKRRVEFTKGRTIDPTADGPIFYPVMQYPSVLCRQQQSVVEGLDAPNLRWIQDIRQILCYEDKQQQMLKFSKWMPETHVFMDYEGAYAHASGANYPLVSKAREGSSSYNVRILKSAEEGVAEVNQIFNGQGLPLKTQPKFQRGYWLVQEFIPHNVTFRVTIVGTHLHVYKRFCYPDKSVAAPASIVPTEAVNYDDVVIQGLMDWSRQVFEDIGTKFCAIDVLYDHQRQKWVLLETSLAWARGDDAAANSPFHGSNYSLNTQWDLLIDEIQAGVFGGHELVPASETPPVALAPAVAAAPAPVRPWKPLDSSKLSVVCWLWDATKDGPAYQSGPLSWREKRDRRNPQLREQMKPARKYLPEHVNALQRQFARYLPIPHRFVCIADSSEGLSDDVDFLETPAAARALAKLPSPEGARFPSCYRRLWTWSDEAQILGDRVLLTDIDTLLMRDISHLVDRDDDFIGWRPKMPWGGKHRIMGALYMMRTGAFPYVWSDFRGHASVMAARAAGYRGSDQAWIGYKMGQQAPVWPDSAGIYSIRDLETSNNPPPKDACLIQFNGPRNPWQFTGAEKPTWVAATWRSATAPATIAAQTEVSA